MSDQLGESFRQSRRELRFQLVTWAVFAAWVVGYGSLFAYDAESPDVTTTLGMPSWVVWGVGVPWLAAFALTTWFAGWFMQDTELVDDTVAPSSPADSPADPGAPTQNNDAAS